MADNQTPVPGLLTEEERAACEAYLREQARWDRLTDAELDALDSLADRIGAFPVTTRDANALLWADDRARALIAAARADGVREERARCASIAERVLTNAEANRGEDHDTYHEGAEDAAREILDEVTRATAPEGSE